MKDFVKMTLAVLCGLFIAGIIGLFMFITMIGSMAAAGSAKAVLPRSGVLVMDLSTMTVREQSMPQDPFMMMQNPMMQVATVGLWDAVHALDIAADDPAVQYIYIKPEGSTIDLSTLEELRVALDRCRQRGKTVIAYMTNISTGAYYLASAADKVYTTSYCGGMHNFVGMSGSMIFVKDLLDKLNVNVQLIRHGKYKSAGEMFVRNAPSAENMQQNEEMVRSMWHTVASAVAASRGISEEKLNSLIDNLELVDSEDFLEAGLVDALYTREELAERLAVLAGASSFNKVSFMNFQDYVTAKAPVQVKSRKKLAVIYADGNIVDGNAGWQNNVAGGRFASILADVRADSTVKAVVLRVNSPGGSVLASEQIRAELELLKADKPVIASYGSYAASGGYWISSACDKIYSDATTLTGSIGVFSMIPDLSGTARKIAHVNVVPVNSNRHSDILSGLRPLDAAETASLQRNVEDIYSRFVTVVSEGRGLEASYVDDIAQGRVWTGSDALGKGLVDEIGTLEDAIRYAAISASEDGSSALGDWQIVGYPAPATTFEMLVAMMSGPDKSNLLSELGFGRFGEAALRWTADWKKGGQRYLARLPFELEMNI